MKDILRVVVYGGLFLIPFLTLLVTESLFFPYITGKNFAFRIIIEIVLACWIVLALFDAQYRPRFSWILTTFSILTGVMFVASIFAYYPHTALWSNYERMDGFVMLVHVFAYFVVLGSMMRTPQLWNWFFHTSLVVASFTVIYGLQQLSGNPNYRIDSTLGNSTYMGVYMLFHIGILGYLALQTPSRLRQLVYAVLAAIFFFVLIQTGTRGTAIGFAVGTLVLVGYIALFGFRRPHLRQYAIGGCLAILVLGGGFWLAKDTATVQENPTLARIANIDLKKDLEVRRTIWGMAWEGVKERPALGWGVGNFNYVFNGQYDPRLYGQEQWFDRVHNIVLDWLIYGGVIGFLAYVSVFISIFYYLVYRPWRYDDQTFSVLEQALLAGLLIGYALHNMVVFDNLISYIFFAAILAFIHYRVATPIAKVEAYKVSPIIVQQIIFPIVFVMMLAVVYFVNVPAILSAKDIISALSTQDLEERYTYFDQALTRNTFAKQEVVEQFVQQAIRIHNTEGIAEEVKSLYFNRAEAELHAQIARKPGDARLHVFASSFYRTTNDLEKTQEQLAIARELSPNKQWIILQQGAAALTQEENETARDYFAEAFLLDERFMDAREYYVASLFLTADIAAAKSLMDDAGEEFFDRIALNNYIVGVINQAGEKQLAIDLFERRVELNGSEAQTWASLAFLYYEQGDKQKAIETLDRAAKAVPAFKKTAGCIQSNINLGREPNIPCS